MQSTLGGLVDVVLSVQPGATFESSVGLLVACQRAVLARLELFETNRWEGGSPVVLGCIVVNLMDRDGGVRYMRLNRLSLDNRLDILVDMLGIGIRRRQKGWLK